MPSNSSRNDGLPRSRPFSTCFLALALCAGISAQDKATESPQEQTRAFVFDAESGHPLFDRRNGTLDQWTPVGGRYDGKAIWTIEDGSIRGREGEKKAGGLLYTKEHWHSFRLSLEVRIAEPFDSGIFLFMVPREQATEGRKPRDRGIQVTLDARPGGELGGIYADGWLQHNEKGWEHWRSGEWNRVECFVRGTPPHITTWLNGKRLSDYQLPRDLAAGFAPTGRIGIQVHGGGADGEHDARFRDIRIQELPVFDEASFDCDERGFLRAREGSGWTRLFDGESLDAWRSLEGDAAKGTRIEDGVLSFLKEGGDGTLASREDFEDFELQLDFQIAKMANSGLFLRAAPEGNPAFSGCEIQILDDFNWEAVTKSKLAPYQFTGGLYGALAPSSDKQLFPLGRWNSYRIRYVGSRLRVELNGIELYDIDTHSLEPKQGKPFAERAERGFIGLQRHAPAQVGDEAWAKFRNVWVKRLARDR